VPLPAEAGDAAYAGGFAAALERLAERFRPEVVLVSAGFDAHAADPVGGMCVSTEGFAWMSRALEEVAEVFAGGRIVSLLEGGYHPEATAAAAAEHVRVLARADEMM
jgi:acetoin utilization deacetylase AcuC-like enzyme